MFNIRRLNIYILKHWRIGSCMYFVFLSAYLLQTIKRIVLNIYW